MINNKFIYQVYLSEMDKMELRVRKPVSTRRGLRSKKWWATNYSRALSTRLAVAMARGGRTVTLFWEAGKATKHTFEKTKVAFFTLVLFQRQKRRTFPYGRFYRNRKKKRKGETHKMGKEGTEFWEKEWSSSRRCLKREGKEENGLSQTNFHLNILLNLLLALGLQAWEIGVQIVCSENSFCGSNGVH